MFKSIPKHPCGWLGLQGAGAPARVCKPDLPVATGVVNLGQFPWILVMGEVQDSDVGLTALSGPSVSNQWVWHGQPAAKVSQGLFL